MKNRHLHLTDRDWAKLQTLNQTVTRNILRKIPSGWDIPEEDISGAVYDTIIHLLSTYRPGTMSPVSYCYQWAGRFALRDLLRDYRRTIRNLAIIDERIDAEEDDVGNVRHEIGIGEVDALTVDDRNQISAKLDAAELLAKASAEDREIMLSVMEGKSYQEIADNLGISKVSVLKRLRKYGEGDAE